jgi:hypothetical protein
MKRYRPTVALIAVLLSLIVLAGLAPATVAAPPTTRGQQNQCVSHRQIVKFNTLPQVEAHGFFADLHGNATISFAGQGRERYVSLGVETDFASPYVASRLTEIDTALSPGERVKCWQATTDKDVVVEYRLRFDLAETPLLTENAMLWNAPFSPEENVPITAVGVTRNQLYEGYVAIIAQQFNFDTFEGFIMPVPMPGWLDPSAWHDVRLTVGQYDVVIEVAQGDTGYTVVAAATLPEPLEPLAFEFSVDNELFPGFFVPVLEPDAMDVAYLEIRLR